jgi:hypothetical protein
MAFIREYAAVGDPFSLRRPKWLRKLKIGRGLGKVAKGAFKVVKRVAPIASFLPIPGAGLAARLFGIAQKYGIDPDVATEFARTYGVDIGDPDDDDTDELGGGMSGYMGDEDDLQLDYLGDPAPKAARKRKTAGAGPRVKAQKKKAKRRERAARKGEGFGRKLGKSIGAGARAVGAAIPGLLEAFKSGGPAAAQAYMATSGAGGNEDAALAEMMAAMGGKKPKGAPGAFRFGGKRRTINPANVRALRRSMRRVEGFQTLVKRINKAFPALRGQATMRSPRRARGHRAGCGCVVCRRAA